MDAALESSALVIEPRQSIRLRGCNLNLRSIDDDTCVRIQVLEGSWHTFLNRSLVWPKGILIDARFKNFRPATV